MFDQGVVNVEFRLPRDIDWW